MPFLAELLKLLVSVYLLREQQRSAPEAARMTRTWQSVALFPFPSIIYWVHNNVQVRILMPPLSPCLSCCKFPAASCHAQFLSTAYLHSRTISLVAIVSRIAKAPGCMSLIFFNPIHQ